VEAGKPPSGTAHGELDNALEKMATGVIAFPQQVDLATLTGKASNGANVLLINARVTYWFPNQARLDAQAAVLTLANVGDADEAHFKAFDIQIGGIDAIAGVAPIKKTTFPNEGLGGTWSAELGSDFRQEWDDAGAKMTLTYFASIRSFDPYSYRMGFSPVLTCELEEAVPLQRLLDDWITPIRSVVSIATGRSEDVSYLTVYPQSEGSAKQGGQLFGLGITQRPYESAYEVIEQIKSPLQLKVDDVSLLVLVRAWQNLMATHHPLVETYGSMLHARDQHPRSRFLLLLQAIEGTHGYETQASFAKRLKAHTAARDQLVRLAQTSLDGGQLKFLERNLNKRPSGGLEPAITWLTKRLPGATIERLAATDLVTNTLAGPEAAKNAPDALRIIRNDLAHGTKGYNAFELDAVVNILEEMVRAHALELLGVPEVVTCRVVAPT